MSKHLEWHLKCVVEDTFVSICISAAIQGQTPIFSLQSFYQPTPSYSTDFKLFVLLSQLPAPDLRTYSTVLFWEEKGNQAATNNSEAPLGGLKSYPDVVHHEF